MHVARVFAQESFAAEIKVHMEQETHGLQPDLDDLVSWQLMLDQFKTYVKVAVKRHQGAALQVLSLLVE